jgi:hypothetical protein
VFAIERQLNATADPRIEEFCRWTEDEVQATHIASAPLIAEQRDEWNRRISIAGFDQTVQAELARRIRCLLDAVPPARELKQQALSPQEVLARLREIYATIPPMPLYSSVDRKWRKEVPGFLTAPAHS